MLNSLSGNQLIVEREGSFIRALTSKDEEKISLILVNYDIASRNIEAIPITFKNLSFKNYKLIKTYLNGQKLIDLNLTPINGEIRLTGEKSLIINPNSIILLELIPS